VEFPEVRDGPDGLLLLPRDAKVEAVDPDPGSIVEVTEDLRTNKGVKEVPYPIFLFPKHQRQQRRLFEHLPVLGDINQRQMGDCWFLAALAAIVGLGTGNAIKWMMSGQGDHAYVRLWDRAQMPHYVCVDKGLIEVRGPAVFHSTGGLWAAVLEKAMTAIDKEGRFDPQGTVYGRLKGGQSHIAFQALLGVEAESSPINAAFNYDATSADWTALRSLLRGDLEHGSSMLLKQSVFGGLVPFTELNTFYDTVWVPWVEQTSLLGRWMGSFGVFTQGRVYRLEDFERFMREFANEPVNGLRWSALASDVNAEAYHAGLAAFRRNPVFSRMPDHRRRGPTALQAVECVCQWVRRKRVFSGRRSTGVYTALQVRLYDDIVQHLNTYRPVCLGTYELVGTPDPELGSSGEKKSKGLAGAHGYAVTGCYKDNATGARFVQVFNPWGRTGRGYTFSPNALHLKPSQAALQKWVKDQSAYETDEPLFWLELADVTKRCNQIYTCKTTPEVIKAGRRLSSFT
jgi:hypothetical protein